VQSLLALSTAGTTVIGTGEIRCAQTHTLFLASCRPHFDTITTISCWRRGQRQDHQRRAKAAVVDI
jgi:hypothetical protein